MGKKPRHPVLSQKALIVCGRGDILLVRRSKSDHSYPGRWEFPGGKLEPGSSLLREELARELGEELGKKVRIKPVVDIYDRLLPKNHSRRPGQHVIVIFYRVLLEEYEGEIELSDEHSAFRWVSLNAALKVRLPPGSRKALKRFIELERDKL
ncbi:MAG: NUDIX domain-containing protein [bacterium]|nr:NUDIX domain-containing protein [bacterium]